MAKKKVKEEIAQEKPPEQVSEPVAEQKPIEVIESDHVKHPKFHKFQGGK